MNSPTKYLRILCYVQYRTSNDIKACRKNSHLQLQRILQLLYNFHGLDMLEIMVVIVLECSLAWNFVMFPPHFVGQISRNITDNILSSYSILLVSANFRFVPGAVMITLITWISWCLPDFITQKLYFSFVINKYFLWSYFETL